MEKELLAERLLVFTEEYGRKSAGTKLTLTGHLLDRLTRSAAGRVLPKETAPIAELVHILTIGVEGDEEKGGIFGRGFGEMTRGLAKVVVASADEDKLRIAANYVRELIVTLFLVAAGGATCLVDERLAELPGSDGAVKELTRLFSFELLVEMIAATDAVEDAFDAFLTGVIAEPAKRREMAKVLDAGAFLIAWEMGTISGGVDRNRLLIGMKGPLLSRLTAVQKMLDLAIVDGKAEGESAKQVNIALKKAIAGLQKEQAGDVIEALYFALKSVGVSADEWDKDMQAISRFNKRLISQLIENDESSVTEITGIYQTG